MIKAILLKNVVI